MFVLIVSPYRPQVCHEHQNRSGRRKVSVNQDFQIDQSETQIEILQIYHVRYLEGLQTKPQITNAIIRIIRIKRIICISVIINIICIICDNMYKCNNNSNFSFKN